MYVHGRIRNKTLTEEDKKQANVGWYNAVRFEWENWLEHINTIRFHLKAEPPNWLLHQAIYAENVNTIEWCFENIKCDINDNQILLCLRPTKVKVVLLLIHHGLNLTSNLFDNLCSHPHVNLKIIDLLLGMECPYTDKCLYHALKWNNIKLYHHLLKKGIKWTRTEIEFTFHSGYLLSKESLERVFELFSTEGITVTKCIYHDIYAGKSLHWTKEEGYLF